MEKIIDPVSREAIRSELIEEHFLRHTNKGQNQLYLMTAHSAPNIMREIGRLREESFRAAGGGTGKALDVDEYDTAEYPFEQLIVWDPENQAIMAGYRMFDCSGAPRYSSGRIHTATAHLFDLSPLFYEKYLPHTLELGRSFVQPMYQRGGVSKKGIFAMDNLWDGLGAMVYLRPEMKYMFGKVTMYPQFNREARNMILSFMRFFFPDHENLVTPIKPLVSDEELKSFNELWQKDDYKGSFTKLNKAVRDRGEIIPPLINSYMGLSSTMKSFGTALNDEFGEVEETGIMVTIADIYPNLKDRHVNTYEENNKYTGPDFKLS
jgi:hypothetical protein